MDQIVRDEKRRNFDEEEKILNLFRKEKENANEEKNSKFILNI